jgi:hypothetical protein
MPQGATALALALLSATALASCASAPPRPSPPPPAAVSTVARRAPPPPPACAGPACVGWAALLLSGGRDREQNAVAHERNIAFATRTLSAAGVGRASRSLLFADGDDPRPDVQFEEPDAARRRLLVAIGLLLSDGGEGADATLRYRNHELGEASPATRDQVLRSLRADAARAEAAFSPPAIVDVSAPSISPRKQTDLLLYVTDHGIHRGDGSNNVIVLWGRRDLSVRDLGAALDRQPPERRVVSVMAQCFSGSFSALVHEGGDPSKPVARHDRCGFFAAPADRPAAGCSPRSDESLYDDYTTRFFAALGGKDRAGAAAPDADADGDGRVSFEEAHFAAVALERTQDVPVSTSEELLRRGRPAWVSEAIADPRPLSALFAGGRPALVAAAASLARSLGLREGASAADLVLEAERGKDLCWPGLCEAEVAFAHARTEAQQALRLAAQGTPMPEPIPALVLATIGRARLDTWVAAAQPHFDRLLSLDREIERLRTEAESHDARVLRLRRLIELQAAERRLEREGGELLAAYRRVQACEASGLWERPAHAPANGDGVR